MPCDYCHESGQCPHCGRTDAKRKQTFALVVTIVCTAIVFALVALAATLSHLDK